MHELSLMAGMLGIIAGEARGQGFTRVSRIVLEIGALSGVEPEALRFAFDVSARGTVAEGAELEIEETEGRAQCGACGHTVPVRGTWGGCPACGTDALKVIAGKETRVKYLDVD
ncbi:hydrogenase maturation nickel metallochaperone HypA [Mesoterricola silvestris]|uniref:Hydrogenase maturation factor HypA n=1 Tax=Mesoterricola silvestris TaxID=2927979 RepID=A0AA48GH74_9BACT|nr:hydrogenase maturation nickel metallochaperone HypA [Mesoterricola silvestris]BDU72806.1 putative hydrogenase nickel incorporation protein HypA 2 [Mesoterricola silvestris]